MQEENPLLIRTPAAPDPNPLRAQIQNAFKTRGPWTLTGLALALLVVLVLPSAQIELGAKTLQGLIGSYTYYGSGWVPCKADGTLLQQGDMGLNSDGSANLMGTSKTPTATPTGTYASLTDWWLSAYSPNSQTGSWYYPGLGLNGSADNYATGQYGNGQYGYYDSVNYGGDRSLPSPTPPDVTGSVTGQITDTLSAYFKWVGPDPVPDHAYFLLTNALSANASASYGQSQATSGLSGTATASLDKYPETAQANVTSGQPASQSVTAYHLLDVLPSGDIATVSEAGTLNTATSNSLAWGTWHDGDGDSYYYNNPGQGDGNGPTSANASAFINPKAQVTDMDLTAHSTADTDRWDPHHPRFFSGTGCTVSANIGVNQPYIKSALLLINGVPVKQYPNPDNPNQGPSLSVMFDSTQFGDGTQIEIKYQVWGRDDTSPIEKTLTANAYNKGYLLNNTTLANGGTAVTAVGARLGGMHHTPIPSTASKDVIIGALPTYTVFYAWTHSLIDMGNTTFGDGSAKSPPYPGYVDHYVYSFNVLTEPNAKTVDQPPYNFAFIDGCQSAVQTDLAYAFLYENANGGSGAFDRAYFGWNVDVADLPHNANWTNRMWQNLQNGETLSDAVRDAGTDQDAPIGLDEHNFPYSLSDSQHTIFGDGGMKLHGVWGGTSPDQLAQ